MVILFWTIVVWNRLWWWFFSMIFWWWLFCTVCFLMLFENCHGVSDGYCFEKWHRFCDGDAFGVSDGDCFEKWHRFCDGDCIWKCVLLRNCHGVRDGDFLFFLCCFYCVLPTLVLKMDGGPIHSLTGLLQYIAWWFFHIILLSKRNQTHIMQQSTIDNVHPWFSKPKIMICLILSTNFLSSYSDYPTTINQKKIKQRYFLLVIFSHYFALWEIKLTVCNNPPLTMFTHGVFETKNCDIPYTFHKFSQLLPGLPDYNQPKKNSNNIFFLLNILCHSARLPDYNQPCFRTTFFSFMFSKPVSDVTAKPT